MKPLDCDLLIIGSGFGGAVCACRAAEAGLRVIVLERGRPMNAVDFEALADGRHNWFHRKNEPGLIERPAIKGLSAGVASAVGGGSRIYTAVTAPARSEIFDERWPAALRAGAMDRLYGRVDEMIRPIPLPVELERTSALCEAARCIGATATRPPLAVNWPDRSVSLDAVLDGRPLRRELVDLVQGGRLTPKRSLDQTYLRRAEQAGARIFPLHEALALAPTSGGWSVVYRRFDGGYWSSGTMTTRRVVLAAGAINTVRLLLEARDLDGSLPRLSAAVGRGFFTNGDLGGLLLGPRSPRRRDGGPPVTAWVDLWREHRVFLMETGLLPPLPKILATVVSHMLGVDHRLGDSQMPAWSFGVMGFEDRAHQLTLRGRGRLAMIANPSPDHGYHRAAVDRLRDLADATGATLLVPPEKLLRALPVTVHPLGGAAMADDPERGVVDPRGEVYGSTGLFIADGSLLPTPTGVAPSMTIAAIAEHVAERIIQGG